MKNHLNICPWDKKFASCKLDGGIGGGGVPFELLETGVVEDAGLDSFDTIAAFDCALAVERG